MSGFFVDILQGLPTLRILGMSRAYIPRIRKSSEQYQNSTMKVLRVAFLSALVLELVATLSVAVVAVEISLRLLYGRMMFGQALFLLLLAPEFYLPLRNLSARFHSSITGNSASMRIAGIFDQPVPDRISLFQEGTTNQPDFSSFI